jgi:hypothetical protein
MVGTSHQDNMACSSIISIPDFYARKIDPHMDGKNKAVHMHISDCITHAAKCVHCRLILQAIELFRPGWIEANQNGQGMILHSHSGQIDLTLGPYFDETGRKVAHMNPTDSFTLIRRSKGMYTSSNLAR